jgi:phosphatidylglycerol lysyltransferase
MNFLHPSAEEFRRARELVLKFGWSTISYQILNPGIQLWFSSSFTSVIGYVTTSTHHIAAGAPIGDEKNLTNSVIEFTNFTHAVKKKVCFFGAQERIASILAQQSPTSSILLGTQPIWTPQEWIDRVYAKPSLRAQFARAKNKGVHVELWNRDQPSCNKKLARCLQEWIASRHLPPMHFLVEPNTLDNLEDRIVAAALRDNELVGFCIASPIPMRNGWLIEQIIRGTNAPNGTAELLLEKLIVHLHSLNSSLITLGLSPLSKHVHSTVDHPFWLRNALRLTRLYGTYFYNFEGLDTFKAKFQPSEWEPVYAITNEPSPTPMTLHAIATAFSGMSPFMFVFKGIAKSLFRGV